ncbi:MAG: hypothetical protein KF805_12480 [Phycisphaeraceae bacterium]|nr:hypothetical protein [Phycisphaeraceae bacterium]
MAKKSHEAYEAMKSESPAESPAEQAPAKLLRFSVSVPHLKPAVVECASREDALPAFLKLIGATRTAHAAVISEVPDEPGA